MFTSSTYDAMAEDLRRGGLDIAWPFELRCYNDWARPRGDFCELECFGVGDGFGVLVANTARLWRTFLRARSLSVALRRHPHPLDAYVRAVVEDVCAKVGVRTRCYFADDGGSDRVSMVHLADFSGLAKRSPSYLAIHPEYGPWWALRAVISVQLEPSLARALVSRRGLPQRDSCTRDISDGGRRRSRRRDKTRDGQNAVAMEAMGFDPCTPCSQPCVEALERARGRVASPAPALEANISDSSHVDIGANDGFPAESWRDFVAVRDACPLGKPWRYGDDQLRYHYTRDVAYLVGGAEGDST